MVQIAVVGNLIVSSVLSRANAPDFALFFLTVGTFVWIIVFTAVFTSGMSEVALASLRNSVDPPWLF